jgi:hypothetical protein
MGRRRSRRQATLGQQLSRTARVGKLCAFLDRSWDTKDRIKKRLEETIPPLQERAKRTNQILCEFLRSLKPK